MPRTPYTAAKVEAGLRAIVSIVMMAIGFLIANTKLFPLGIILAVFGTIHAARNSGRLIRLLAAEAILANEPHARLDRQHRRASMPRKIFWLLFSVAEIDGAAGPKERELVRQFLLERFQRPDLYSEIRGWNATPIPLEQIDELVHELRATLSRPECETVFTWCCCVALIDEKFKAIEHELLQKIARHFSIPQVHARRLFLHAKTRVMGAQSGGPGGGRGGSSHSYDPPPAPRTGSRKQALHILGLPDNATSDEIRKRHRELVKKYHPDAHSHLGDVAAREATERFREIQSAYESLTA